MFVTLNTRPMRNLTISTLSALALAMPLLSFPLISAQESADTPTESSDIHFGAPPVGRAFSATKYARLVKAMPDGKLHFIRNERYPTRVARSADGSVMMHGNHVPGRI